ncbi:PH domain-containing protein [Spongiactinospora sp. TRM90649]|uniref:PH domain-containing protein n=1 Tax=Spongiactinospora sp. TRM90649 TaxID=3031114 RepID=UPI0023F71BD6|nr:PH domain-containing protein [Spongiactinospora sp. TRM90649]MDF5757961.1 PH domain-containing protein [Spongiactinospora sp. TRM90649]
MTAHPPPDRPAGPEGFAVPPPGGGPPFERAVAAPARLSPRVLLIDPVRVLPSLFVPLAGVLFVGGFSPASFGWAAFGVAASIVYSVVRWATFTYQVVGDRLELTRALVSRSVRTIPLERVRGVDISTPPLHRLLGLAVLRIDTGARGGGEKQEGELNGVTVGEAERLKGLLLRRARPARGQTPADAPAGAEHAEAGGPAVPAVDDERAAVSETDGERAEPEIVYARVPRRWLLYGPLSGAYLLTPFALVAGAIGLAFQWGEQFGFGQRAAWDFGTWLWDHPYLLIAVAVLLVLAMPVAGAAMYAVFNWDFTLRSRDGYLVAERGLINRRSVSLERRRIRGFEIVEALTERAARVARVWAIVTGLGDSETRGQLLPASPLSEARAVTTAAIGTVGTPLRPHPPAARRRRLFRAVAPWLLVTAVAVVAALLTGSGQWWAAALPALLLALLGVPLGIDRYRSLGHTYDGIWLSVRSGSLRRRQAVIERRAVVGWTLRQTWFQRRARVLTVIAGVGAGVGGYAALDVAEDTGPAFAAEVTPEWLAPFVTSQK